MTTKECSTVGACPFSFTDDSEYVQNLGCLPSPYDIITMRKNGKTWACHSNPNKPCLGALNYLKENGLDFKVVDKDYLNLDNNWGDYIK